MGRVGRRRKQLLDVLKGNRGYWKLKEQALYRALWSTGCGRGCKITQVRSTQPLEISEGLQTYKFYLLADFKISNFVLGHTRFVTENK
jgi:hypothetical protein